MRIADSILKMLEDIDTEYIFGIPASTFGVLLDSINDSSIDYIVTKNEAGATYSASKYAELSKKLGVCMLCGGVGVNNAINGIGDAKRNKVPMLIISGDVRRSYMGKGAIQEFDNAELTKSVTKYSVNIRNENDVLTEFKKAIEIATTVPYGPVLVSIPYDVQLSEIEVASIEEHRPIGKGIEADLISLEKAVAEINGVSKGLIFIGRGTRGLSKEVKELSSKLKWPIISTPNAKGVVNTDFPYYIGNYGFCSSDAAVEFVEKEDVECVLVLGTSLGQAATRDFKEILFNNRKLIRVDSDSAEFNRNFKEDISVLSDIKTALEYFNTHVELKTNNSFIKPELNRPYIKNHTGLSLRRFFEELSSVLPQNSSLVVDAGDFFNYIFKYMPIREDIDFQSSINYASMGNGVAGVMGSYLADSERVHCVFVGDGGFYMNGMEILTAREYGMPIIYFVINNSMLGLVKNGQKAVYGRELDAKIEFEYTNICTIAKGMGLESVQIRKLDDIHLLEGVLEKRKKPLVVEVITDGTEIYIDTDRLRKV